MDIFLHEMRTEYVFVIVLVTLCLISFCSFHIGLKLSKSHKINTSDIIASSIFQLLSLILGFSFSLVIQRSEHRRELGIREAGAISEAYLVSHLLRPVLGKDVKEYFKEYVDLRVKFYNAPWLSEESEHILQAEELVREKLWKHLQEVVEEERGAIQGSYMLALNKMFGVQSERNFVINRTVHIQVYFLILCIMSMAMASLYFDRGHSKELAHWRPHLLIFAFSMMITFIYDMDHPRSGFMNIGQEAMLDTQRMINR